MKVIIECNIGNLENVMKYREEMKNENPTTEGATIHVPAPCSSLTLMTLTHTHANKHTHTLPNGRGRYLCLEEHENCFTEVCFSHGSGLYPCASNDRLPALPGRPVQNKSGVWEDGKGNRRKGKNTPRSFSTPTSISEGEEEGGVGWVIRVHFPPWAP